MAVVVVYLSICLSARLKRIYSAWLPQFLHLATSTTYNSARPPDFLKLTTLKTNNSERLPQVERFPSKMESWVQSWLPRTNPFAVFPLYLPKVSTAPATKKRCQVIQGAAPVTQNHLSWLGSVLRAATACNCSSLIWPDCSAPAALASLLFDLPAPQIIGKHSVSRLSFLFAHLDLLSSNCFDLLSSSLLFFDSSHLCF